MFEEHINFILDLLVNSTLMVGLVLLCYAWSILPKKLESWSTRQRNLRVSAMSPGDRVRNSIQEAQMESLGRATQDIISQKNKLFNKYSK